MSYPLVCVMSVRGNVGASTLALHLAGALGGCAVDVHLCGGLDVLAGIEDEPGPRWHNLHAVAANLDARALVSLLPQWWNVPVLAGSRLDHINPQGQRAEVTAVAPIIDALNQHYPVVLDACPDVLLDSELFTVVNQASVVVIVAGRDVTSTMTAAQICRNWAERALLVARCHPGMSLAPSDMAETLGIDLGPIIADTPRLVSAVEAGVGPSRKKPNWVKPGRVNSPAPVSVAVAATRLAIRVRRLHDGRL